MRSIMILMVLVMISSVACDGLSIDLGRVGDPVPCGQMASLSGQSVDKETGSIVKSKWEATPSKGSDAYKEKTLCDDVSTCTVQLESCVEYTFKITAPGYKTLMSDPIVVDHNVNSIMVRLTSASGK